MKKGGGLFMPSPLENGCTFEKLGYRGCAACPLGIKNIENRFGRLGPISTDCDPKYVREYPNALWYSRTRWGSYTADPSIWDPYKT